MYEKVSPAHPDKVADRIAGALVDYAYSVEESPKIAVEVLIGHKNCHVITETSVNIPQEFVEDTVIRICKDVVNVDYSEVPQDVHLANNQNYYMMRCGDNGIFKGVPVTEEQRILSNLARQIYTDFPSDGKYIFDKDKDRLIVCQSGASRSEIAYRYGEHKNTIINPLGDWDGGVNVDTGATNRKLGSDMGDAVTGGGLHGKDLSKADVSINIYAHLKAQETGQEVKLCCAIGDTFVDGRPFEEVAKIARGYIDLIGGFEKLAEWGLI